MRAWYHADLIDGICLVAACVLTACAFVVVYVNTSPTRQPQEWNYNLAHGSDDSSAVEVAVDQ